MKQTKNSSYNSTPHTTKENICPNLKLRTYKPKENKKEERSPSIKTDSEFSVFNTINVMRPSQENSIQTKSRYEVERIIQNISNNQLLTKKDYPYTHKSFMDLLSLAVGKESISINEAIEKCEEFQISCKDQLITLLQQKQPSRQWPLPLSSMLLTDLGQLKILHLCSKLQNQQDLNQDEYEILQFLLPKSQNIDSLSQKIVLQFYNEFRNQIDQKFNIVDKLVQEYTLNIQPKIKKIKDKVLLIKIEKKLKQIQKINQNSMTFLEFKKCLSLLELKEEELLTTFRYLYFIENDHTMHLVDRKQTIKCSTCIKQILQKQDISFSKYTVSTLQIAQNINNQVISCLLQDKTQLLQEISSQQLSIQKLNSTILMMQLQYERQRKQKSSEYERGLICLKNRYEKKINMLERQNEEKYNLLKWYKNELEWAVEVNQKEMIANERGVMFKEAYRQIKATMGSKSEQLQ